MPYLPTAQSFLEQSRLLISARPATARISTKYTLPNLDPSPSKYKPKSQSRSKIKPESASPPPTASSPPPEGSKSNPPKATLTLKTYDPISGTCLKYETDKAAEVGRLVVALGSCGRLMAALPDKEVASMDVDEGVKEEPEGKVVDIKSTPLNKEGGKDAKGGQVKGEEKGGGGGKKKKKGKR